MTCGCSTAIGGGTSGGGGATTGWDEGDKQVGDGSPSARIDAWPQSGDPVIPESYEDAKLAVMCGQLDPCTCDEEQYPLMLLAFAASPLTLQQKKRLLKLCCLRGGMQNRGKAGRGGADIAAACSAVTGRYICQNEGTVSAAAVALIAAAAVNPILATVAKPLSDALTTLVATCHSGASPTAPQLAQLCSLLNTVKSNAAIAALMPASLNPLISGLSSCCQAATPDPKTGLPWWTYIAENIPLPPGWTPGSNGGFPVPVLPPGGAGTGTGGGTPALPPAPPTPALPPTTPPLLGQRVSYGADGTYTVTSPPDANGDVAQYTGRIGDAGDPQRATQQQQAASPGGGGPDAEDYGQAAGAAAGSAAGSAVGATYGGPIGGYIGGVVGGAVGGYVGGAVGGVLDDLGF